MTVEQLIEKSYLTATGKPTAPAAGTTKYNRLLNLADNLQRDWEAEPGVDWHSRYEIVDCGTITATDTFDLDDTIRKVSTQEDDFIKITVNGQSYDYDLVPPQRLANYSMGVAQIGRTLKFYEAFTSSHVQYGGTLTVPAYTYVDDLTLGTDEVQVDDPMWLVYMVAAEYVRNDTVKQNQYGNLIAKAQDRMNAMKQNNASQLEEVPSYLDVSASGESWT